jgi:hypothetical protein
MRAARGVLTDAVEYDLEPARQNAHDVWTEIDRRGAKCANERCIHRGVPLQARGKPAHKAQPPGSMAEARQRPQALPGRRNAGQPDRPAQRRLERWAPFVFLKLAASCPSWTGATIESDLCALGIDRDQERAAFCSAAAAQPKQRPRSWRPCRLRQFRQLSEGLLLYPRRHDLVAR